QLDVAPERLRALGGAQGPHEIDHIPAVRFAETRRKARHALSRETVAHQPEELAGMPARTGRTRERPEWGCPVTGSPDAMAASAVRPVHRPPRRDRRGVVRHRWAAVRGRIGVDD